MMTGSETDYWDVSVSSDYTIALQDSMTVSSGDQWLLISALNGGSTVWSVTFLNSTAYQIGGSSTVFSCINGLVYVVVNSNSITFIGTTSNTVSATFTSLTQIRTANGDGDFNGGNLEIALTTS
jgi:NO-binding membrane sensor protein with MHYT domain